MLTDIGQEKLPKARTVSFTLTLHVRGVLLIRQFFFLEPTVQFPVLPGQQQSVLFDCGSTRQGLDCTDF